MGIFNLDIPALSAYVNVWVDEGDPRHEIISSYAWGGNPAPGASSDGQVALFGDTDFSVGEFTTLQAVAVLPPILPGHTIMGQGYRLSSSSGAPDLNGNGFSINCITCRIKCPPEQMHI